MPCIIAGLFEWSNSSLTIAVLILGVAVIVAIFHIEERINRLENDLHTDDIWEVRMRWDDLEEKIGDDESASEGAAGPGKNPEQKT